MTNSPQTTSGLPPLPAGGQGQHLARILGLSWLAGAGPSLVRLGEDEARTEAGHG